MTTDFRLLLGFYHELAGLNERERISRAYHSLQSCWHQIDDIARENEPDPQGMLDDLFAQLNPEQAKPKASKPQENKPDPKPQRQHQKHKRR